MAEVRKVKGFWNNNEIDFFVVEEGVILDEAWQCLRCHSAFDTKEEAENCYLCPPSPNLQEPYDVKMDKKAEEEG